VVEVVDLTWHPDDWRRVLAEYFAARSPMLVGVTLRNACSRRSSGCFSATTGS
jgi:hypothetical protein